MHCKLTNANRDAASRSAEGTVSSNVLFHTTPIQQNTCHFICAWKPAKASQTLTLQQKHVHQKAASTLTQSKRVSTVRAFVEELRKSLTVCSIGPEAATLQKKFAGLTPSNHKFTPWVTLNGVVMTTNKVPTLLQHVCKLWEGEGGAKPSGCKILG